MVPPPPRCRRPSPRTGRRRRSRPRPTVSCSGRSATAAAAVVGYVARARAAGAARVAVVATSAVREAANGRAFVTDLERAAGVAVRVISGEEEARLTLAGIVAGLGPLPGVVVAFDIGG